MARITRKEKLQNLVMETYRELYANCTVPVSFDELVEKAELDDNGRKIIPYNEYFIDKSLYDTIVERQMKTMRLTKSEKDAFKFEMYLGCGPSYLPPRLNEKLNQIRNV